MSARTLLAGAAASVALATPGRAAPVAPAATSAAPACLAARPGARQWPAPLDRAVTWSAADVPLGDALDRLAAAARVRVSYASDLLPVGRRLCAAFDAVPLGDALVALLGGVPVEPVVAGAGQIVLAPTRATGAPPVVTEPPPVTTPEARSLGVLDRVLVTDHADDGPSARSRATAVDVVDRAALADRGTASLAGLLGGSVPGVWMWEQPPSSAVARWGSLRGASSFGASAPKVYIDGIPVANPLLLTQIDADVVERIEVARGPQGAALFGAGALGGAVNIVARHAALEPGQGHVELRSRAGIAGSDFVPGGALAQDHALALRYGAGPRTAGLTLGASALGEVTPGESTRRLSAYGDARLVGSRATVSALARILAQRTGAPERPALLWNGLPGASRAGDPAQPAPDGAPPGAGYVTRTTTRHDATHASSRGWDRAGLGATSVAPSRSLDSTSRATVATGAPQSLRQYTLGATVAFPGGTDGRWTHTAIAGIDGYRLADETPLLDAVPSAADSALLAARGGADRGTLRFTSVAHFGDDATRSATVTIGAEHSVLREATEGSLVRVAAVGAPPAGGGESAVAWRSNSGLLARSELGYNQTVFATAGLRLDRNAGYAVWTPIALLPVLGAAVVRDVGPATVKLRAAYGRGIRPPEPSISLATTPGVARLYVAGALAPESQAGTEAGLDLLLGRRLGLHVTRFDQRASGLVQPVLIGADTLLLRPRTGPVTRTTRLVYQMRNVGEIANRGWELQGTASAGRLSLAGALAFVDSRVMRLASGYDGDLQPGDRMLEVPARTASLSATWAARRWSTSWTVARATDWIAYDRLALDAAVAERPGDRGSNGAWLRAFWRDYDGVTRLRASFSRDLFRGAALTLTGDNLLDERRGEPDNATVVVGRTVTLGARLRF